jgi:hypothetical protein
MRRRSFDLKARGSGRLIHYSAWPAAGLLEKAKPYPHELRAVIRDSASVQAECNIVCDLVQYDNRVAMFWDEGQLMLITAIVALLLPFLQKANLEPIRYRQLQFLASEP